MSVEGNNRRVQVKLTDSMWDWLLDRATRADTLGPRRGPDEPKPSPDIQARKELEAWRRVLSVELAQIQHLTVDEAVQFARIMSPPVTASEHALYDALSRWKVLGLPATVEGFADVGLWVTADGRRRTHEGKAS